MKSEVYYGKILHVFSLFVCPVVFLSIKMVSKIQTKPVMLGPTIALNTHTGHDTIEDDTHSFSNLEFKRSRPLW